MKKVTKFLVVSLIGLSLVGLPTTSQASSLKSNSVDKDIVLFQNTGDRYDDCANFILIECKSNNAMKTELADIKKSMASNDKTVEFNDNSNVKNIYYCTLESFDADTNKKELITGGGTKSKLSKKTTIINLNQILFAE